LGDGLIFDNHVDASSRRKGNIQVIKMRIDPASIELDKCYRTQSGQVRLVIQIEGDDITCVSRGPRHFLEWHETAARNLLPRARFARDAVEEVPYSWEPEPESKAA